MQQGRDAGHRGDAVDENDALRRGTDGAMARQFLANMGHVLPRNFVVARLVYLTDTSRQKNS